LRRWRDSLEIVCRIPRGGRLTVQPRLERFGQAVHPSFGARISRVHQHVQHSDEVYSKGVQNMTNESSFDKAVQLCATSHAIVQTIQNTCVDCLLRMLFDSGADHTMMKRSAVSEPIIGLKTSCHWCDLKCTLGLIEDMIPPEFSATTCILGPIRAIIMDNVESSYDLIIGMDLMQT
jgi:hypothetical protein